jgi:RNA polymerase sigma-70 factor, ECF subfamily
MDEHETQRLVQMARAGDRPALQRLLTQHYAAIRARVAAVLVNGRFRRHVDPEDVVQQAYVAALRAVQDAVFDGPAAFYRWLEQIAINEAKCVHRHLRRQKRDVLREVHDGSAGGRRAEDAGRQSYVELVQRLTADDTTPSRRVGRAEAVGAVLAALAGLTDEQRAVVQLRFLEGRPVAEVAQRLGKSEDAIHALSYRGLKELRGALGALTSYLSHQ